MKKLLLILLVFCIATMAFARPELPVDGAGVKLQGFAPDGKKNATLTVNSTTKDMRDDIAWSAYTPTACSFRLMSTATKSGTKQTLAANAITPRIVNSSTPFINFTGCTSGELTRQ